MWYCVELWNDICFTDSWPHKKKTVVDRWRTLFFHRIEEQYWGGPETRNANNTQYLECHVPAKWQKWNVKWDFVVTCGWKMRLREGTDSMYGAWLQRETCWNVAEGCKNQMTLQNSSRLESCQDCICVRIDINEDKWGLRGPILLLRHVYGPVSGSKKITSQGVAQCCTVTMHNWPCKFDKNAHFSLFL